MAHTTDIGAECEHHLPRVEDLLGPATLGVTCFAALHDLASALQAIGAAIDELDATVGGDPVLRPLVDAAIAANERATAQFVASRGIIRDPARRREVVELRTLVNRAGQQAREKPTFGDLPDATVEVAIPVISQILATLIDAAAPAGRAAVTARVVDGGDVEIAVRGPTPGDPPAALGTTLAIAARVVELHGGAVRCGDAGGHPVYTVRLPGKR